MQLVHETRPVVPRDRLIRMSEVETLTGLGKTSIYELMKAGKITNYFCQGFNPLLAFPNRAKLTEALSKLKLLVIMDPLETETARFWENHGEHNDVDTAAIQTEVIQLPTTCFAEDDGSLVNSGRWLQWHWAAGTPQLAYLSEGANADALFAILQHYGFPTNYVDFTTDPAVAGFFSADCVTPPKDAGDSVIYCLDTDDLRDFYADFDEDPETEKFKAAPVSIDVSNLWRLGLP